MQVSLLKQEASISHSEKDMHDRQNILTASLMFLISPFIAFLVAIKRYKSSWSRNIVWFFVAFYGFTFVISSEGIDSAGYRNKLVDMHKVDFTFYNFYQQLYSEETQYVDIVQPVLTFLVSRFTDDYRILFAIFGLLFGYFYSRNIWYLIDKSEQYIKKENIPIIITFAIVIGFWQINGVRMNTAAHIFLFGAVQYLNEDNKKGFIIS